MRVARHDDLFDRLDSFCDRFDAVLFRFIPREIIYVLLVGFSALVLAIAIYNAWCRC